MFCIPMGILYPFCQYREFDKNADSAILVSSNARILNWFGDYRSLRFLCDYFGSRTFYFRDRKEVKMKRIIAIMIVLCLCVGIVGCANTSNETETISMTESNTTEEQVTTLVTENPTKEEVTEPTEPVPIPLELGVPVEAGVWQYTLVDVQFAREIGNSLEYENYLVPGGTVYGSNPFALEDDETLAVVTYKIKMIGKEKQRPWDVYDGAAVGTGKFIYGDGFVFETETDGSRAQASYFDGESFKSMSLLTLEPLSEEIECRVDFALPLETVENENETLVFQVAFDELGNNMTFAYTIR